MSICLNIAEGAGEFSGPEKARLYRIARRSATECAAVLDICTRLRLSNAAEVAAARTLLVDIVSVLTVMAKNQQRQS
jgi:four helix bundle protein